MKRILGLITVLLVLVFTSGIVLAAEYPYRNATSVTDTFKDYTADEWIVSPTEESKGDQTTSQVLECDIRGIIACYDTRYLRVDILLHNSLTPDWYVFYVVKFEYEDSSEYYTYYPNSNELVYEEEVNGKITTKKNLKTDASGLSDYVGYTSSGSMKNDDIYFIINKNEHIAGDPGKIYYLTTTFYAGYVSKQDELKIADQTITVNLRFQR